MSDCRSWLLLTGLLLLSPSIRGEEGPAQAEPARAPHPEPRVIVHVLAVRGPHPRAALERSARQGWGRIVSCYKASDRRARGLVGVEFRISSSGQVTEIRRTRSTLKNRELAACLSNTLKGLPMPEARAGSIANAEIHVAPGDAP